MMYENQKFEAKLSEEELLVLKGQAIKGDTEAKDRIILTHMRLAFSIAGHYIKLNSVDSDDLVSAAVEGVVSAVDKISQGILEHDNVTGYIVSYIHRYCTDFLNHNSLIYTPRNQRTKLVQILNDIPENEQFDLVTFNDSLEKIIKTPLEKEIVRLRREGYTDNEVANLLNIDRLAVTRTRHNLLRRFTDV